MNRRHVLVSGGLGALAVATTLALPVQAQAVRAENATAMQGSDQVVVGSFVVAFLTDRTDTARAGGGLFGSGSGGRSTTRSALEGVADADFQAITDGAYEQFLAELTEVGYQVVADRGPLVEAFRRANAQPLENGLERDVILARDSRAKARVYAPSALGGLWLPREVLGQISAPGFTGARSAIGVSTGGTQYARANGQGVVNAFYVVDFAQAETYGGWFRNSSAVSVQAGLALTPDMTKVYAYAPNGRVPAFTLREPVAVGGDYGTFGDTTSGASRAAETAANVIGILGGLGTNRSRRFTFQADPARWREGASELTAAGTERLVQALRSGR